MTTTDGTLERIADARRKVNLLTVIYLRVFSEEQCDTCDKRDDFLPERNYVTLGYLQIRLSVC